MYLTYFLAGDGVGTRQHSDHGFLVECDGYQVRLADSFEQRSKARLLIERLYAKRGYETHDGGATMVSNLVTLVACSGERLFGTLSIGVDTPQGLAADQLYRQEIDACRGAGRRVGEFSRLAVDPELGSKHVLASLFHLAYIQLSRIFGVTDAFIEVHPRHTAFYRRMLGFAEAGPTRTCPRVNAPATLLCLDMAHAARQIHHLGGARTMSAHPAHAVCVRERSLYPYFFSQHEEDGLVRRAMRAAHPLLPPPPEGRHPLPAHLPVYPSLRAVAPPVRVEASSRTRPDTTTPIDKALVIG